jgi:acetyl-CoA synthetase
MHWQIIDKPHPTDEPLPNLVDYDEARSCFAWETVRGELDGLPGGKGLNIAHEAVDQLFPEQG